VRRELLSGTSRFVGFFGADLATPVETLTAAMGHLPQDTTAVIASRHVTGASIVGDGPERLPPQNYVSGIRDLVINRKTGLLRLIGCRDLLAGFAAASIPVRGDGFGSA